MKSFVWRVAAVFLFSHLSLWASAQAPDPTQTDAANTVQGAAAAESEEEAKPIAANGDEGSVSLAGVPAIAYSNDFGFGFGLVGTVYQKNVNLKPYRYAVDVLAFMTTKGQHDHYVAFDLLGVGGKPVRVKGRAGFYATQNQNFCGLGSSADCRETVAEHQADAYGLTGQARKDFIFRYFKMRYFAMYAAGQVRWRFVDESTRIEFVGGWRGTYYLPGQWKELGVYKNSLFDAELASKGKEKGFASVFETGLMFDSRDNEFSPTSGYWLESMVRFSVKPLGSSWHFAGFNLSGRTYVPLIASKKLIWATQAIFDGIVGDAPLEEMVRVGNSQGYSAFGGSEIGRGLREQMFPGRVKLLAQTELRYTLPGFKIVTERFDPGLVAFMDAGVVAWKWQDLLGASEPSKRLPFLTGFGVGARLAWNEAFVIRFDLAFSPQEGFKPYPYLKVRNVF